MEELTAAILEVLGDLGAAPVGGRTDRGSSPDLLVRIPAGDGDTVVPVDVKHRTAPLGAAELRNWRARHGPSAILGLPYVTSHQGQRYRANGVQYVDARGNASIDQPGFVVRIEGRPAAARLGPLGTTRPPSTTPAGLQVVFVLLLQPHRAQDSYQRLAGLATVSKGSVASTMADLRARGHLVDTDGSRRLVDRRRLTDDWLDGFSRDLLPKLEQRELVGPPPGWWLGTAAPRGDWAVGGGAALVEHGARLRPDRTTLYGAPPWTESIKRGRLTRGDLPNVVLRRRFWSSDLLPGTSVVPPLLAYADALSGSDPREVDAARELWPNGPGQG